MRPEEFKRIRQTILRLGAEDLASLLHVHNRRTVHRWETGERDIPGPAQVIMAMLRGRPDLLPVVEAACKALLPPDG